MAPGLISEQVAVAEDATMSLRVGQRAKSCRTSERERDGAIRSLHNGHDEHQKSIAKTWTSALSTAGNDEVHDMVCVGFGPAALGVAVAVHDMYEADQLERSPLKVRFLEKQTAFFWHAGMLLPGAKMQISFLKDLATLRNPRSHFTFLNYLKEHDRLVSFTNLGTFLPSRLEFEDYMRWAANHFEDFVDYSQSVEAIQPLRTGSGQKVNCLEIKTRNSRTGECASHFSKNVVVAVGGMASRPAVLNKDYERLLHTSEFQTKIGRILPDESKNYSIAVVGSGQSAAEVFNDLHTRYPKASTRLIMRDTALRPSDDSPFVNEVFNPEAVDTFYEQPHHVRSEAIKRNKATNYSVVRLELLEHLYQSMYAQSIHEPDRTQWQHQILPSREVVNVVENKVNSTLDLTVSKVDEAGKVHNEVLEFDAVILATGYRRDAHVDMLRDCQEINGSADGSWVAGRDYSLSLDRMLVEDDVGIWLQGCNESSHGLADSLLSIVATRGGELVHSIFGK